MWLFKKCKKQSVLPHPPHDLQIRILLETFLVRVSDMQSTDLKRDFFVCLFTTSIYNFLKTTNYFKTWTFPALILWKLGETINNSCTKGVSLHHVCPGILVWLFHFEKGSEFSWGFEFATSRKARMMLPALIWCLSDGVMNMTIFSPKLF